MMIKTSNQPHSIRTRSTRTLRLLALSLLLLSILMASQSLWISGKAHLAQILLEQAWQQSLTEGTAQKPWPWADTKPVARLYFPNKAQSLIVLQSSSGESLAFGPGLVQGNPQQMDQQVMVLGGHRDSHLSILSELAPNEPIQLQAPNGTWYHYTLAGTQVVDSGQQTLAVNQHSAGLILITCYPFSATQTGGPLRFVASATAHGTLAQPPI